MRRPRHSRALVVLGTIVSLGLVALGCGDDDSTSTSTGSTLGPTLTTQLQEVVDTTVAELGAPGAVVVVDTPDGRWETAVGTADVESSTPVEAGLRWPLRSITKSFTTTLVLQLADEGALSLDDPISTWLEGIPGGDEVTVRQLATMTSGLADYTNEAFIEDFVADPERQFTLDELIAYGAQDPPVAEPGAEAVYTNTNTNILGRIVEEVTGQPFDEVLTERILDPLGLEDTVYPTSPDQWTSDATGYQPGEDGGLEPQPVNYSVFGPAGAMITTADDLLVWGEALATGELVEPGTQTERLEGQTLEEGPEYDRYAFGIGDLEGWWGHTGEGFGFTALVMHDDGSDTTVAIFMNASNLESHAPTTLFRRMVPLLSGD